MATVRRIKPKPYRAGQADNHLCTYEMKSLYALVRTLNDALCGEDYVQTRDADHMFWLRNALGDAVEERCERMVKAAQLREDAEYLKTKDGA